MRKNWFLQAEILLYGLRGARLMTSNNQALKLSS